MKYTTVQKVKLVNVNYETVDQLGMPPLGPVAETGLYEVNHYGVQKEIVHIESGENGRVFSITNEAEIKAAWNA